jgi:hypothetical protein
MYFGWWLELVAAVALYREEIMTLIPPAAATVDGDDDDDGSTTIMYANLRQMEIHPGLTLATWGTARSAEHQPRRGCSQLLRLRLLLILD